MTFTFTNQEKQTKRPGQHFKGNSIFFKNFQVAFYFNFFLNLNCLSEFCEHLIFINFFPKENKVAKCVVLKNVQMSKQIDT